MGDAQLTEDDDPQFWLKVSEISLASVWDNVDDDEYSRLIESQDDSDEELT